MKTFSHRGTEEQRKWFSENQLLLCVSVSLWPILLLSAGCSIYAPKAPLPAAVFSTPFLADLSSPTLFRDYNALSGQAQIDRRNQILYEIVWLTDASYGSYEKNFFAGQAYVGTGGDIVNIGLAGVAAVTGTAHLKAVLAVFSSGVTGMRASYEKNFFDQQTRAVIVQKMRSGRLAVLAAIRAGMATPGYSLEQGLMDTSSYFDAGTVIGALVAIAEDSGQQSAAAKAAMRATQVSQ